MSRRRSTTGREAMQRPGPRARAYMPAKRTTCRPVVSDHACMRWMERVCGIDVRKQIEAEVLADGREALIRGMASGRIWLASAKVWLCISDGHVVTVTPDGAPK